MLCWTFKLLGGQRKLNCYSKHATYWTLIEILNWLKNLRYGKNLGSFSIENVYDLEHSSAVVMYCRVISQLTSLTSLLVFKGIFLTVGRWCVNTGPDKSYHLWAGLISLTLLSPLLSLFSHTSYLCLSPYQYLILSFTCSLCPLSRPKSMYVCNRIIFC